MLAYIHKKCFCFTDWMVWRDNVNVENEGTAGNNFWIFEILHFKMRKLMENELTTP